MKLSLNRKNLIIYPDKNRVIARFFFNNEKRAKDLINRIIEMPESSCKSLMNNVLREFSKRHRSITNVFIRNFNKVKHIANEIVDINGLSEWRKLLIGAYFTMEYSIESAALFNPSIIEDPDQEGLEQGETRVIISLRATGEGHISSLVFRRAIIDKHNNIILQEPGAYVSEAEVIKDYEYNKNNFIEKLKTMNYMPELHNLVLDQLKDNFTYDEIFQAVKNVKEINNYLLLEQKIAIEEILWLADSHYELKFSLDSDISERVIFPLSKFEKNGIEDARFVKFVDENNETTYYATYTAYDGYNIMPKIIETKDFYNFKISPLHGKYAIDKNLALFPRKINGKYAMISRIDGVNNYIMFSDNLYVWDNVELLEQPEYPWELVQIGNCGSPIETDRGWLLLTHGVGPVRKYCIGACLLDLDNPQKIIGRLDEPLLLPSEEEREGYVPNVVYSCGSFVHNNELIIPYGMSDYATRFASVNLNELLDYIVLS